VRRASTKRRTKDTGPHEATPPCFLCVLSCKTFEPRCLRALISYNEVMAEQLYVVTWECISCGHEHSFRHTVADELWPNKFELECANPGCGQAQDVPFRKCTVEPFRLTSAGADD